MVVYGDSIYKYLPKDKGVYPEDCHYRSFVAEKLIMAPIECVSRDYLCGSYYKQHKRGVDPYDLQLPPNLPVMYKFDDTIATPTAKSKHDEPLETQATIEMFPGAFKLARLAWERCDNFFIPP